MRRDHDLTHTSKLGVVCDEQEQAIVEEFFHLFKTTWEFCVGILPQNFFHGPKKEIPQEIAASRTFFHSIIRVSQISVDINACKLKISEGNSLDHAWA